MWGVPNRGQGFALEFQSPPSASALESTLDFRNNRRFLFDAGARLILAKWLAFEGWPFKASRRIAMARCSFASASAADVCV